MSKLVEMIEALEQENKNLRDNAGLELKLLGKKLYEFIFSDTELYQKGYVIASDVEEARKLSNWGNWGNDLQVKEVLNENELQLFFKTSRMIIEEEDWD